MSGHGLAEYSCENSNDFSASICGEELTERSIFSIRTLLHKVSFSAILLFTSLFAH